MSQNLRVAIVGAGPSGLATAANLVNAGSGVAVDIFDREPTPFGLLRYAVAPDQPANRRTLLDFGKVFDAPGVRFLGGVELGRDVSRADLVANYDAVVYATGAAEDRLLGVPGEDLAGVESGRRFAGWYTGEPEAGQFDLTGVHNATIVGLGDTAVDLARMLLKSPDALADSEIPQGVYDHLAAHRVREVTILVRRGPEDCQLKARDLEQLLNLPGVGVRFDKAVLGVDVAGRSSKVVDAMPLWRAAALREVQSPRARLKIRFWTRPIEFRGETHVDGVKIERTTEDAAGRLVSAGGEDMIPSQLVLRATGWRGMPVDAVPFDGRSGRIPTRDHRVTDLGGTVQPGEYAAGWVANGWVGGFGTQRRNGLAVAQAILADHGAPAGSIDDLLAERGVVPFDIGAWRRVDAAEENLGAAAGRGRVRIGDPNELLRIARGDTA